MTRQPKPSCRPAFTLVELLVVISIITMLMAILLPALRKARTAADIIHCASNMRQQGIAMAGYTTDFRGYFVNPWSVEKNSGSTDHGRETVEPFAVLLHPYLAAPIGSWTAQGRTYTGLPLNHRQNAWTCRNSRTGWRIGSFNHDNGGSYTINSYLYHFLPDRTRDPISDHTYFYPLTSNTQLDYGLRHENRARRPSTTIAMSEGHVSGFGSGSNSDKAYTIMGYPPSHKVNPGWNIPYRSNKSFPYHNNIMNFLFLDGHAKGWDQRPMMVNNWSDPYLNDLKIMSEGKIAPLGYLVP